MTFLELQKMDEVDQKLEEIDISWRQDCSCCGEAKGYDDFYKDKRSLAGLRSECKVCTEKRVRVWREANSDKRKAIDKASKDRFTDEEKRQWSRRYGKNNRVKCSGRVHKYRKTYPERARANSRIYYATRIGRIIRPNCCQSCGRTGRIEGSHTDYSKALEVDWLCTKCHRRKDNAARLLSLRGAAAG